jgi:hypothetical protein
VLLIGMGLFLHLSRPDCETVPAAVREGSRELNPRGPSVPSLSGRRAGNTQRS